MPCNPGQETQQYLSSEKSTLQVWASFLPCHLHLWISYDRDKVKKSLWKSMPLSAGPGCLVSLHVCLLRNGKNLDWRLWLSPSASLITSCWLSNLASQQASYVELCLPEPFALFQLRYQCACMSWIVALNLSAHNIVALANQPAGLANAPPSSNKFALLCSIWDPTRWL